jgi:putative ABC transport system permease protein
MAMILLESVTLSLLGGIVGIAAGAGFVKLLQMLPRARGFIEGDMSINLTVLAITVALVLGALSGLYPAYRASRLQPSEALRYE